MGKDQKKPCSEEEKSAVAYNPALHVRLAKKLRKLGETDEGLADAFNVTVETLSRWQSEYAEFSEACNEPPSKVLQVEEALFKLARGYTYVDERPMNYGGILTIVRYERQMHPDLGAIIFILLNLAPDKWKHWSKIVLKASSNSYLAQLSEEIAKTTIRPRED